MGLIEYQAALARAYTDREFRDLLRVDPAAAQRISGLGDDGLARLLAIPPSQLDFFAMSLISKRRGEVAKFLPLTARALGGRFRDIFAEFASTSLPSGTHKHLQDAIAFAEYLVKNVTEPPHAADIARYEAAWIDIRNRPGGIIVRMLRYSPGGLIDSGRPSRQRTLAVWVKLRLTGLRHWIVPVALPSRRAAQPLSGGENERTGDGIAGPA